MPRITPDYQPREELTQVQASPNVQAVQARYDPRGNSAYQLAEALGVAMPAVQDAYKQYASREEEAARRYANSVTVDELNKQVKDGKILESQSPVYVATLRHIYGENGQRKLQEDTLSQLQTGQLKFNTNEELDKYLTDKRNEFLAGQDKYTVAGFDKSWNRFRDEVMATNSKVMNDNFTRSGYEQASEAMNGVIKDVTSPLFQGTPQDAAQALVSKYRSLVGVSLFKDEKRKEALLQASQNLAMNGNKEVLQEFLKADLDNGIKVGSVIGNDRIAALEYQADTRMDKKRREAWRIDSEPFIGLAHQGELTGKDREKFTQLYQANKDIISPESFYSILDHSDAVAARKAKEAEQARIAFEIERSNQAAQLAVEQKVESGLFFGGAGKPITVVNKKGELDNFDQKAAALDYLQRNPKNLDFKGLVAAYGVNGLENPDWKKIIATGASNLATVGWKYDGKNMGELSPQGEAAVRMFLDLNAIDPTSAQKHAGDNYLMLKKIALLTEKSQNMTIQQAASLVNQAEHSGIPEEEAKKKVSQVKGAGADIVSPHWYSNLGTKIGKGLFAVTPFGWYDALANDGQLKVKLFGNDKVNTGPIDAEAKELTAFYMKTGLYSDANEAYQDVVKQMGSSTTVINNTIYHNKDLPTLPPTVDRKDYMEHFIKEVPGKLAESKFFSANAVRLHPMGDGNYRAMIGNVPLQDDKGNLVTYSPDDIQKWGLERYEAENLRRRTDAEYETFRNRIDRELAQNQKKTPYFLEKFDPHAGYPIFNNQIMSREGYDKLREEGLDKKPLTEVMQTLKARRNK